MRAPNLQRLLRKLSEYGAPSRGIAASWVWGAGVSHATVHICGFSGLHQTQAAGLHTTGYVQRVHPCKKKGQVTPGERVNQQQAHFLAAPTQPRILSAACPARARSLKRGRENSRPRPTCAQCSLECFSKLLLPSPPFYGGTEAFEIPTTSTTPTAPKALRTPGDQ